MSRARLHVAHATTVGVLAVVLLAGCSPQLPSTESFTTAIPAALLDGDLGVIDATATNGVSGLAVDLDVTVTFDRGTVTAEELARMLSIIVESNNLSNPDDLKIIASDGSTEDEHDRVDLGAVGVELGFERNDEFPEWFTGNWDDVVAFVDKAEK